MLVDSSSRLHLAGITHAVSVRIVPEGETVEFLAAQHAVAVVVQRGQRVVPRIPEQPESLTPPNMESAEIHAFPECARIVDEPTRRGN